MLVISTNNLLQAVGENIHRRQQAKEEVRKSEERRIRLQAHQVGGDFYDGMKRRPTL